MFYFRYCTAILLISIFPAKIILSLHKCFDEKRTTVSITETDENKEEKSEKDTYKEKSELTNYTLHNRWLAFTTEQTTIFYLNSHPPLPVHFCSVPTPPPWA